MQAGLPVVCLGDTGGAATDLFNYSLTATMPPEGAPPEGRDKAYLLEASELIPMIVKEGAEQGGSTKPKLSFFLANYDLDGNDIDFSIMQCVGTARLAGCLPATSMRMVVRLRGTPVWWCTLPHPNPLTVCVCVRAGRCSTRARPSTRRSCSRSAGATWPSLRRCALPS